MPAASLTIIELKDRTIDLVRQIVVFPDGRTLSLTTREAQLLGYLAARAGQDVTRDELLQRVWEYRASYATRAVDVTMRRLRAKIEPDERSPAHLISVHGVGYRFVPVAPGAPPQPRPAPAPSPPSLPPAAARLGNRAAARFVGREEELALLEGTLGSYRLVSVLGPGGVGKSRLVSELLDPTDPDPKSPAQRRSEALRASFPGGLCWVDLEAADGPVSVTAAVAGALGLVMTGSEAQMAEMVGQALAGRGRLLVVLDSFERHTAHAQSTVGRWLQSAGRAVFIVTSRERLRLEGERVVDVPPLPAKDAAALLRDRLEASGVPLGADDQSILPQLLDRLDYLPLAIELAAPRARLMSLTALCSRLDERFKLLQQPGASGRSGQPARTLRAVLDQSWELLTEEERWALSWCSTFVGGFTLEAAEILLGDDSGWPLDRIEALRDKSLIRTQIAKEPRSEPRLELYNSVRDYALQRLEERPDSHDAYERHARLVVDLTEQLATAIEREGGRERLSSLAAEADNLLAVIRRHLSQHSEVDASTAVRAALALEPLLSTRGPLALLGSLVDSLLPSAQALDRPDLLARLLVARGRVHRVAGENEAGRTQTEAAIALLDGISSRKETATLALAWSQLAMLRSDASQLDLAVEAAEKGLQIARAGGHRAAEGTLLGVLAAVSLMRGDDTLAERLFLDAIRIDEEVGNEIRLALDQSNLGLLLTETGRLDEAEERLIMALKLHTAWGNLRGMAMAHQSLAMQRTRQSRMAEALAHAEQSLTLYLSAAYTRYAALADQNCALLAWALRQTHPESPDPLLRLERAVSAFDDLSDTLSGGMARVYFASALAERGQVERAEEVLAAAKERFAPLGNARAEGLLQVGRGFIALGRGDIAAARRAMEQGSGSTLFGVRFLAEQLSASLQIRGSVRRRDRA